MQVNNVVLETIVVDNGSTDKSVSRIAEEFPEVKILAFDTNLGFTGGNNAGIKYAMLQGADYVWLLNNDTMVDKDALSIVSAFDNPAVGIAGSKIFFAAGHEYHKKRYSVSQKGKVFWYAGGIVDWDNMYASHRGVDEVDSGQYDAEEQTVFITGCSMMIRRSVIEKIGVLDDAYYLYLEDLDYCLRARSAGFLLMYYPRSVVWHVNAGSSGGAGNPLHDYYITRNRLRVGLRFAPIRTKVALIREAVRFLSGKNPEKKQAVADFFKGRMGRQYEPKKNIA
jgi:GT2 family glycosyltransferase